MFSRNALECKRRLVDCGEISFCQPCLLDRWTSRFSLWRMTGGVRRRLLLKSAVKATLRVDREAPAAHSDTAVGGNHRGRGTLNE